LVREKAVFFNSKKMFGNSSGSYFEEKTIALLSDKEKAKKAGSRNPGGSATALVFQRAQLK
jgi:hypothetical protein